MKTVWYKVLAVVAAVVSGTLFVVQLLTRSRRNAAARNAVINAAQTESDARAAELRRNAETTGDPDRVPQEVNENVDRTGGLVDRLNAFGREGPADN